MEIVYEVRATSKRVIYPVHLLVKEEIEGYTGFRSIFGYPPETAAIIREQQGTFNLDGCDLYSDTLFLDFDDADEAAWVAAEELKPYTYKMWNTGGRGFHIEVDIEPMRGPDVSLIQKAWLKTKFPLCDYNIMKTSGVIRLPGTFHSKRPGQFKHLVRTNEGSLLKITPPVLYSAKTCRRSVACDDPETAAEILDHLLFKVIREGTAGRNNHAYKIACQCRDLGKDSDEALLLVETWNASCSIPPQRSQELASTVRSAYRRQA